MRFVTFFTTALAALSMVALAQTKREKPILKVVPYSCAAGRTNALRDYKGDSLKYYYYGIAGAGKKTIEMAALLRVKAISMGCTVDESVECYNTIADSLIYTKWKVHLSKLR